MATNPEVLLRAHELRKHFALTKGGLSSGAQWTVGVLRVLNDVSFEIMRGETLAVVGAKGSGKSTLCRAVLWLLPDTGGQVWYAGQRLADLRGAAHKEVRRKMQIVFQDPYSALSPRLTVSRILAEPMDVHGLYTGAARGPKIAELLRLVGLNPYCEHRWPTEFSGAQRHRIAIARALALSPEFLVWDEPESTLDPAAARGLLDLLIELRRKFGLTVLMTTSDEAMAQRVADRVVMLQEGKIGQRSQDEVQRFSVIR